MYELNEHRQFYGLECNVDLIWRTDDLFGASELVNMHLPEIKCPACSNDVISPSLPRLSEVFQSLPSFEIDLMAYPVRQTVIRIASEKLYKIGEYISPIDFLGLIEVVRMALSINPDFPVLPFARTTSLPMPRYRKGNLPIGFHLSPDDTLVTLDAKEADLFLSSGLTGFELLPCEIKPMQEERYELVVMGTGRALASDLEIASYQHERYRGEEALTLRDFLRCPICTRRAGRQPLVESNIRVSADADFFRLYDFYGIYVSSRAMLFLKSHFGEHLIFNPVMVLESI